MKNCLMKKLNEEINEPAIELYGNKRVIISDCRCVDDYTDEYIILDVGNVFVRVSGAGLLLSSYVFGQADIRGEIVSLEFLTSALHNRGEKNDN